jgi:hypothetical protein
MYAFGSVSAVGSWFCISVTSSVRKSLAEIVVSESDVLLDPVVEAADAEELADRLDGEVGPAFPAACRIDWNLAAAPPPGPGAMPAVVKEVVPACVAELPQMLLMSFPIAFHGRS